MNNKLLEIQEMIMRQMKRLDDDKLMEEKGKEEVARGNALSLNATTLIKTINVGIRIIEMTEKFGVKKEALTKELGVINEE